ncbi:MAG: 23S rRNA (uracil(1939)-C(5))-methyltransferase RlmD [Microcystaceae cyanobacterium]
MSDQWQQGALITLEITDVSHSGDGVGRSQGKVVFVPNTVTGDRCSVRLIRIKKDYSYGQLQELLTPSPHRIRPRCLVADKCGGCQWQHIEDAYQKDLKYQQVRQALTKIGQFTAPPVSTLLTASHLSPLSYRNKATYPIGRSPTGQVKMGYYRRQSHQIVNLNQCPVQDERLNPLLAEIKQDIQKQGWSIYNETKHQGKLRHLSLRIGRRTGEILLTLVSCDRQLSYLNQQAQDWMQRYPQLVGVILNLNAQKTNVIFGQETEIIAGRGYIKETFADLTFHLASDTFFQINTEAAETLLDFILQKLDLQGTETLIDAYCGIGTFTLPLAKRVKMVYGIESYTKSIEQAKLNAQINQIDNVKFIVGKVEDSLDHLKIKPDILLLDPPRKGCDRQVMAAIRHLLPPRLVYISCQPSTLARDLALICQDGVYQLQEVQPIDFFPQTAHVECLAFLESR